MGSIELAELKLETSVNIHKMKSQIFFIFVYLRNKYIFNLQHLNLSYFLLLSWRNQSSNSNYLLSLIMIGLIFIKSLRITSSFFAEKCLQVLWEIILRRRFLPKERLIRFLIIVQVLLEGLLILEPNRIKSYWLQIIESLSFCRFSWLYYFRISSLVLFFFLLK